MTILEHVGRYTNCSLQVVAFSRSNSNQAQSRWPAHPASSASSYTMGLFAVLFAEECLPGREGHGIYPVDEPQYFIFRDSRVTAAAINRQRALVASHITDFHVVARREADGTFFYAGCFRRVLPFLRDTYRGVGLLLRRLSPEYEVVPRQELGRPLEARLSLYFAQPTVHLAVAKTAFLTIITKLLLPGERLLEMPTDNIWVWNPKTRRPAHTPFFQALLDDEVCKLPQSLTRHSPTASCAHLVGQTQC